MGSHDCVCNEKELTSTPTRWDFNGFNGGGEQNRAWS